MSEALAFKDTWKWVEAGGQRMEILRGVSLEVQEGEFLAITGPSGSGKSTLLHLAGLLDRPSQGGVFLNGQDVSALSDDERARQRATVLGFVFQNFNLLPYYTALENVALPMGYAGTTDKARPAELLKRVGMSHRLHAFPSTMSGGERQRVALARALVNNPKIVLADEPTGALDSQSGGHIMELLMGLRREGMTLIVVTHDAAVAQRAGRVVHVKDGRFE